VPVPEAPLEETTYGLVPKGKGWFVLSAREAPWVEMKGRGVRTELEGHHFGGEADFSQLGINVRVLQPGEPMSMYHWEADQEDFLVLSGEALAIVEGEERPMRAWDLLHCPAGTNHVVIGAGDEPCVVVAVGARDKSVDNPDWGGYPVDETALKHGAGVEVETSEPDEAYAKLDRGGPARYGEGWLP
jgi:uncharacterized cupin superfamily protein